jgi:Kef-type K+ transport system membrane component KefB
MTEIAAFLHIEPWPPAPGLIAWVLLTLVGGALLGEAVFRWMALPRIVGYGAAGMVVAAAGLGLHEGRLGGDVRLIVDLSLGLLLFELGSRVSLRWLRANPVLLWTSVAESIASFGAVFVALLWLGFDTTFALACGVLTMSASGAMVGRVSTELKTSGQITERMIVLTALNTLYAVLALKLLIGGLHMDQRGDWAQGIAQPLYTFAGSVLLAALLWWAVSHALRRFEVRDENTVLLLLGLVLIALTAARMFGLSTVLVPLLAGVMLRNLSERPCIWPRHFGTAGGVLVLMLFVVVGATSTPAAMAAGALGALALLAARFVARLIVLVATARSGGIEARQGMALALTLTPVSATTLVLLAELRSTHPELGDRLALLVLPAVALMALAGPILVEWGLQLGGEHRRAAPKGTRP